MEKVSTDMVVAALSWPQASIYIALIVAAGLVLAVLVWSIFRTGQAAIRSESQHRRELGELRRDVDELRAAVGQPTASPLDS
jgi:flagellar basal body-associated protein FliL